MNNKTFLKIIISLYLLFYLIPVYSQNTVSEERAIIEIESSDTVVATSKGKNKYSFWQSLIHGNVDRSFEQVIDLSIAVAPYYNQEASFGIGLMGSGLYRLDRKDSIMPPSNITISGNASLKGFYGIYLFGNNYFKGNHSRLNYEVYFNNKVLNFWGINYDACAVNPVINYTRRRIKVYADYSYKLTKDFRISGIVDFSRDYVAKINDEYLYYLEGQKKSYTFTGLGASLQYDSRDFIPNPKRGAYLMIQGIIYPKGFGSYDKTLFRTTITADLFQKVWKGAVLCIDLYGRFNSKDSPWVLKEELGGANRMRGYYTGRYIDSNIISAQMEVRQHLFGRFGCAAWIEAGTVFPGFKEFEWDHILPTYGLGLRWEFKHNMNLRIDYGFGKKEGAFVLSISEAF